MTGIETKVRAVKVGKPSAALRLQAQLEHETDTSARAALSALGLSPGMVERQILAAVAAAYVPRTDQLSPLATKVMQAARETCETHAYQGYNGVLAVVTMRVALLLVNDADTRRRLAVERKAMAA